MGDEFKYMKKREMINLMMDGRILQIKSAGYCAFADCHGSPFVFCKDAETLSKKEFNAGDSGKIESMEDFWDCACRIYKPKVKKWNWVYRSSTGILQITEQRYVNKESAEGCLGLYATVLQKIDATEIEE